MPSDDARSRATLCADCPYCARTRVPSGNGSTILVGICKARTFVGRETHVEWLEPGDLAATVAERGCHPWS